MEDEALAPEKESVWAVQIGRLYHQVLLWTRVPKGKCQDGGRKTSQLTNGPEHRIEGSGLGWLAGGPVGTALPPVLLHVRPVRLLES